MKTSSSVSQIVLLNAVKHMSMCMKGVSIGYKIRKKNEERKRTSLKTNIKRATSM